METMPFYAKQTDGLDDLVGNVQVRVQQFLRAAKGQRVCEGGESGGRGPTFMVNMWSRSVAKTACIGSSQRM